VCAQFAVVVLQLVQSSNIYASQSSVATCFRCGRISMIFLSQIFHSPPVKEFSKFIVAGLTFLVPMITVDSMVVSYKIIDRAWCIIFWDKV